MQINNIVIRGNFDCIPHIAATTQVCIAFHSNNLVIKKNQISLKVVKNIRYCLVDNHISTLIKLYIEEELDVDVIRIHLKIVNIHSSATLNLNQKTLIEVFIPKLQQIYFFEDIGIQQDQSEWISIPLSKAPKVSAISLRLIINNNTIKFQLSKNKKKTHLSIITTELNPETQKIFQLLREWSQLI